MSKSSFTLSSDGVAATHRIGKTFGEKLAGGICVCLVGPLGAGKTHFVKGVCEGLDITDEVISPTFILYEEFHGRFPVVHIDLYRLEHESELDDLGVFDLIGSDTILLAEWGDRSPQLMEDADIVVTIASGETNEDNRTIRFDFSEPLREMMGEGSAW
jgi:tRNA threonylcarbamoyladenosine biosynthesis protein TsaE